MGWSSARGEHHLFTWDPRLIELRSPAVVHLVDGSLELRLGAAGKQLVSVCPPSPSEGGVRRTWNGFWDIATMPECLLEEVTRLLALKHKRHTRRRNGLPLAAGKTGRYVAAAVVGESERVRQAAEGTRNGTLNRAAFRLGQLVGQGLVEEAVVLATLMEAAEISGLGEREANATIRSGLRAGILAPRRD
jgi:hypothetical protein